MATATAFHQPQLPWYPSADERRRFWKILLITAVVFSLFSVVIPLVNLPEPPRTQVVELPPRLARLIEQKQVPPPPPKPVEPEQKKEEPKKEEPKKEEPKKEEPKKVEPKKEEPKPVEKKVEEKPQKSQVEVAREKVKKVGVLALSDSLSDLRDSSQLDNLRQETPNIAGGANVLTAKKGTTGTRAVTSGNTSGSGGIGVSGVQRETSGVKIQERKASKVVSASASKAISDGQAKKAQQKKAASSGLRSQEEIQRSIEQNKGAFYRIYNRALRKNPALEGKIVFAITIDKSGAVSKVDIVASDLDDKSLEAKLIARIKLIDFGSQNVRSTTVKIPLDFFPA